MTWHGHGVDPEETRGQEEGEAGQDWATYYGPDEHVTAAERYEQHRDAGFERGP